MTQSQSSIQHTHRFLQMAYQDAVRVRASLAKSDVNGAKKFLSALKVNIDKAEMGVTEPKLKEEINTIRMEHDQIQSELNDPKVALKTSDRLVAAFAPPLKTIAGMGGGGGKSKKYKEKGSKE